MFRMRYSCRQWLAYNSKNGFRPDSWLTECQYWQVTAPYPRTERTNIGNLQRAQEINHRWIEVWRISSNKTQTTAVTIYYNNYNQCTWTTINREGTNNIRRVLDSVNTSNTECTGTISLDSNWGNIDNRGKYLCLTR